MATVAEVYLTTEDLADRWRVSPGTLENQRAARKGPRYVKLGTGRAAPVRYRLADVIDYENSNTREVPP